MKLSTEIETEIIRETDPIYEKVSKVIPQIEWASRSFGYDFINGLDIFVQNR